MVNKGLKLQPRPLVSTTRPRQIYRGPRQIYREGTPSDLWGAPSDLSPVQPGMRRVERHATAVGVANNEPSIARLVVAALFPMRLVIVLDAQRSHVAGHQRQVWTLGYRDDVVGACRT